MSFLHEIGSFVSGCVAEPTLTSHFSIGGSDVSVVCAIKFH